MHGKLRFGQRKKWVYAAYPTCSAKDCDNDAIESVCKDGQTRHACYDHIRPMPKSHGDLLRPEEVALILNAPLFPAKKKPLKR